MVRWWDYWLKGIDTRIMGEPMVILLKRGAVRQVICVEDGRRRVRDTLVPFSELAEGRDKLQ